MRDSVFGAIIRIAVSGCRKYIDTVTYWKRPPLQLVSLPFIMEKYHWTSPTVWSLLRQWCVSVAQAINCTDVVIGCPSHPLHRRGHWLPKPSIAQTWSLVAQAIHCTTWLLGAQAIHCTDVGIGCPSHPLHRRGHWLPEPSIARRGYWGPKPSIA